MPNARSSHIRPTTVGVGVVVPILVFLSTAMLLHEVLWPLVLALLIAAVGFIDDLREIPPHVRLLLQTILSATSIAFVAPNRPLVILAGTLLVVAAINGLNFMDGINGITGTLGALLGLLLASVGLYAMAWQWAAVGVTLTAACMGYLPHNFPRPRSFPGDVLPYFLAATFIPGIIDIATVTPVALLSAGALAPSALDTGGTIIRRIRTGESLITPHRDHAYQRLARRTSHATSTMCFFAMAALCSTGTAVGMSTSFATGLACTGGAVLVTALCISFIPLDEGPSATSLVNGAAH